MAQLNFYLLPCFSLKFKSLKSGISDLVKLNMVFSFSRFCANLMTSSLFLLSFVKPNKSSNFSRASQLNNVKGKEKIIDGTLKKAREKRIPKYNQNISPVKDTTNAKNAKIQKNKNKRQKCFLKKLILK